jgi:Holliday junction DNA helicase RuvA
MIYSLEGKITRVGDTWIALETAGIGFRVHVLTSFLKEAQEGEMARLVCFMQAESWILYGFAKEQELMLFELLNTVSGIGPKIAAKIMNGAPVERLIALIVSEHKDQFAAQAGVSTKIASKIILDVKEKARKTFGEKSLANAGLMELEGILSELGYGRKDIESIIPHITLDITTEEQVRMALKLLSAQKRK